MTNFQKELEKIIDEVIKNKETPKILIHSCCAPCSSYVLTYLAEFFEVTVLYYNPNIQPEEEYQKRKAEQRRLIGEIETKKKVHFMDGDYEKETFGQIALGQEHLPEGGARCTDCFRLRLRKTAMFAKQYGFDYFGTTLTVSPHKNAEKINEIGMTMEKEEGVKWLPSDFKKKEGYKKSIELSKQYDLYRQDYCGCLSSAQCTGHDSQLKEKK